MNSTATGARHSRVPATGAPLDGAAPWNQRRLTKAYERAAQAALDSGTRKRVVVDGCGSRFRSCQHYRVEEI